MDFLAEFLKVVDSQIQHDYKDNWDHARYGPEPKMPMKLKPAKSFKNWLNKKGFFDLRGFVRHHMEYALKFKYLFDRLETAKDKELLLQVLAYKLLGHQKVKLPLNTPGYWKKLESLTELCDASDRVNPHFLHYSLERINLEKIGYPIDFYFTAGGVMIDFIVKQYEYNKDGTIVKAEKGDVVIDGGGCWADTALYFANEAGTAGRVFSFEFIPNNIEIFERNVALNANLAPTIELIRNPLWDNSSTKIYFKDYGPGSRVSLDRLVDQDGECNTMSIDDLVMQKRLEKVDFIKMDIEGAETNAIRGAVETIKKFKPKLAIALYHSYDDFERIPELIDQIQPGYRFYFSHCTIYGEESLLFATAK